MFYEQFLWILTFWAASFVMGIGSFPVTHILFRTCSDKGYSAAKLFGWIAVSYGAFVCATLHILPISFLGVGVVACLWLVLNFFVMKRKHISLATLISKKRIVMIESAFLFCIVLFVVIKGFQPEIYQIERFMDFGFIEALHNAKYLPLEDIWFQGMTLNYYYFGHVLGHTVLTLTHTPTVSGFFLLGAWMFAILAINIYQLGKGIFQHFFNTEQRNGNTKRAEMAAGILSVFSVLFAGTWYMAPWLVKQLLHAIGKADLPSFHYPEPTRIIPGTITEMPVYSFLVADLHAHVWGMLLGILTLTTLFCMWKAKKSLSLKNLHIWMLAAILGIAYMTNSWDAITLGAITVVGVIARYHSSEKNEKLLITVLAMPIVAYLVALPWSIFFHAPIEGVGIVRQHSEWWPWVSFWGALIAVVIIFFIRSVFIARGKTLQWYLSKYSYILVCIGVSIFFLTAIEFFYMKDILNEGEWYRANTVFKVTTQVWLWLGVLTGPILVWFLRSLQKQYAQTIAAIFIAFFLVILVLYPMEATKQSYVSKKEYTGVQSGLMWWKEKYPSDFAAYEYLHALKDSFPQKEKMKNIIEAEGDSYTDVSRFSVFLGWPTIVGWPVHEWTWRGSYEEVGARREEVREVYTGTDMEKKHEILKKYETDYIILGDIERDTYGEQLQEEYIKQLGAIIFTENDTIVIKTR